MRDLDDFLILREIPTEFFFNSEVLLAKSLMAKAWEQVEPRLRKQRGVPLTQWESMDEFRKYFTRVLIRERMLMLFPFHQKLFELLEQDPITLTHKELKKIAKESKKKVEKTPDDLDSWRLLASTYAFLDAMVESEAVLKIALEHDQSFSDAWYMIGALLYGFKRFQDADKALAQAGRLNPSNNLLREYHLRVRAKVIAEMSREEKRRIKDEGGIPLE